MKDIENVVINKIKNKLGLQNGDKLVISRGDGQFFKKVSLITFELEIIKDTPMFEGAQIPW